MKKIIQNNYSLFLSESCNALIESLSSFSQKSSDRSIYISRFGSQDSSRIFLKNVKSVCYFEEQLKKLIKQYYIIIDYSTHKIFGSAPSTKKLFSPFLTISFSLKCNSQTNIFVTGRDDSSGYEDLIISNHFSLFFAGTLIKSNEFEI